MRKIPKILLTSLSGQFGGMEVRIIHAARVLKEAGYGVHVATPAFPDIGEFRRALEEIGVPFTQFRPAPIFTEWGWRHAALLYAEAWQRHVFRRFDADLVHVFFSWTTQGLDNLWLAGRCGTPAVLSIHSTFPMATFSAWHRRHMPTAFGAVRGIYGVSTSALDHFVDIFADFLPGDASRRVIYNFVDTDRFVPSRERGRETRRRLSIPEDAPVLGFVGRFSREKRLFDLVTVFAAVRKQIPEVRLLLIGNGVQEDEIRRKIRDLGCEDAVTMLGFQPDIENYFPAMDIHLLLSRNEGFGAVTAEAMACGVMAVGTRVPGTTEVIGDCAAGRLVALGDEDEAARAAVDLLRVPRNERDALSRTARRHVEENFGMARWRRDIAAFYSESLARSGPPCASA